MWPNGAPSAAVVSFDFDAEEVWIGEDPKNADRPGTLSQGTYGAKVAVPRILDLLDRLSIKASFFVPGRVAERYPNRVREIISAGHEIGHHGYTHTSPTALTREQEESELVKGKAVLEALGAEVVGYRSPSWDLSPHTLDLLVSHGFRYSSNLMDDIRPYRHPKHPIIELPVHWTIDDAPHFWLDAATWVNTIRSAAEVEALWHEELEGYMALGGMFMLTMHPQVIGRPGRLLMLERFLRHLSGQKDIWVTTARKVAETVS